MTKKAYKGTHLHMGRLGGSKRRKAGADGRVRKGETGGRPANPIHPGGGRR